MTIEIEVEAPVAALVSELNQWPGVITLASCASHPEQSLLGFVTFYASDPNIVDDLLNAFSLWEDIFLVINSRLNYTLRFTSEPGQQTYDLSAQIATTLVDIRQHIYGDLDVEEVC